MTKQITIRYKSFGEDYKRCWLFLLDILRQEVSQLRLGQQGQDFGTSSRALLEDLKIGYYRYTCMQEPNHARCSSNVCQNYQWGFTEILRVVFDGNRCYHWREGPWKEQCCRAVRPQPSTCAMAGWRSHPAACWTIQTQSELSTTSSPASRTLNKRSTTPLRTRLTSCKPSPTLPTITTPLQVRLCLTAWGQILN